MVNMPPLLLLPSPSLPPAAQSVLDHVSPLLLVLVMQVTSHRISMILWSQCENCYLLLLLLLLLLSLLLSLFALYAKLPRPLRVGQPTLSSPSALSLLGWLNARALGRLQSGSCRVDVADADAKPRGIAEHRVCQVEKHANMYAYK